MLTNTQLLPALHDNKNKKNSKKVSVNTTMKKKGSYSWKRIMLKAGLFIKNLSPTHWLDDFKSIEITLEEFEYKKDK